MLFADNAGLKSQDLLCVHLEGLRHSMTHLPMFGWNSENHQCVLPGNQMTPAAQQCIMAQQCCLNMEQVTVKLGEKSLIDRLPESSY